MRKSDFISVCMQDKKNPYVYNTYKQVIRIAIDHNLI